METYVIPLTTIYESYPYPALLAGHSDTLHSMESDAEVFNEVDGSAQLSKVSSLVFQMMIVLLLHGMIETKEINLNNIL